MWGFRIGGSSSRGGADATVSSSQSQRLLRRRARRSEAHTGVVPGFQIGGAPEKEDDTNVVNWNDPAFSFVVPYCRYPGQGEGGSDVAIWLSKENERSLSFGVEGGDVAQSDIRCKGPPPAECITSRRQAITAAAAAAGTTKGDQTAPPCSQVSCPCAELDAGSLDVPYLERMMKEVLPSCQRHGDEGSAPFRVLQIGLGGGVAPGVIRRKCPGSSVESVEYDSRVAAAAQSFFGFHVEQGRNTVEVADGLDAVRRRAGKAGAGGGPDSDSSSGSTASTLYDAVLVDCFDNDARVPEHCRSKEFLRGLAKLLRKGEGGKGGVVVQNMDLDPEHAQVAASYREAFGGGGGDSARVEDREITRVGQRIIVVRNNDSP